MRKFTLKVFITIFSIMSLAFISNAQCDYTISLEDTWGDGWNGGAVTVLVNGSAVLTDLTIADGTGPEDHAFTVNPGDDVTTTYAAGSYSTENYYQIKDGDGIMVAEDGAGGTTPVGIGTGTITAACSACAAPIALNALNITETTADIEWTEQGSATAWDVEWDVTGFAPTGVPTNNDVASTTLGLTGLVSGTAYDFYVRADCGSDDANVSAWAGPFTFVYLVGDNCSNAQDLSTMTSPFSGTTVGYTASDIAGMTCTAADNGSANRIFYIDVDNGVELHIGQTTNNFDSRHNVAYGAACPGDQQIVCTDDPDDQEVVWLNNTGSTQRVYYVLAGFSPTSAGTFDFEWSLVTCPDPSSLDAINLTDVTADLSWTTGGASNWDIEWDVTGFTPTGTPTENDVTANPFNITGLTAETTYDFYVRDDCGADNTDVSNWVGPFSFTTTASCPTPTDLSAMVTDVTANLTWNGYAATNWDIEWDVTGFTPTGTPTINDTPDNPYNLTGLTAETSYDFYVRADCNSDDVDVTPWVGPYTFTTLCSAIIAPFTEDFENGGSIPACWSQGATNSENWMFSNSISTPGHVGNAGSANGTTSMSDGYFAWVDDSDVNNIGTTLESPLIDVSGLTTPMLSFYMISNNEGYDNSELQVDVWNGSTWTNEYTNQANTNDWEEITVDLSAYSGIIQLRFVINENASANWYDDVAIDDVSVIETPTCPVPTALTATNITNSSADLGWNIGGSEMTWNLKVSTMEIDPATEAGDFFDGATTDNPHTITGLTSNTDYYFYVQADCSAGDLSTWVGPYMFHVLNDATDFLTFTHASEFSPASINTTAHTIDYVVGNGTDLINYVANFTLSTGATAKIGATDQVSGTTINDFSTSSLTYDVTAEDGVTTEAWTVTVTEAAINDETDFLSFSFPEQTATVTPDATNHTIDIEVGACVDVTALVAEFTLSFGATDSLNGVLQVSGTTANDYTNPVVFEVVAEDGTTIQNWTVTVTPLPEIVISNFPYFEGFEGATMPNCWTILNEDADAKEWMLNTSNSIEGTQSTSVSYNASGNDDWLITPMVNINEDNLTLEFQALSTSSSWLESYNVLISTTGNAPSDFTTVVDNVVDAPNSWEVKTYTLADYGVNNGDNIYIAIQCVSVNELTLAIDSFSIAAVVPDGIKPVMNSNNISIYPNPNNGQFNIALNLDKEATIEVVNALGQVVANFKNVEAHKTITMDLSNEATGLYFVRISSDNNTITKKVNVIR